MFTEFELQDARRRSLLELLPAGTKVKPAGKGRWMVNCPFHEDGTPSMSLTKYPDGCWRYRCFGCGERGDPITYLQKRDNETFQEAVRRLTLVAKTETAREAAVYQYRDEAGRVLYEVVRLDPKGFRQRVPLGNGRWCWSLSGVRRVLYRLPELTKLRYGSKLYLVEGEKDVHALTDCGMEATTSSGGAGGWRAEYAQSLEGFDVIVIPDQDLPGLEYAESALASLRPVANKVGRIDLPDKDVSEWLGNGGNVKALERMTTWER